MMLTESDIFVWFIGLVITGFISGVIASFFWDVFPSVNNKAVLWTCLTVGFLITLSFAETSLEEERDYRMRKAPYEMDCYGWKNAFKDAASFSDYQRFYGGDKENGEMALYYQREWERNPYCKDTLMVKRALHPWLDNYRKFGSGGWDGKTYPWS